jgi:hypothetical protein
VFSYYGFSRKQGTETKTSFLDITGKIKEDCKIARFASIKNFSQNLL